MFEVGKNYKIYEIDDDGIGFSTHTVIEWNAPLLKVKGNAEGHKIFNVNSLYFHGAELIGSPHGTIDELET